MHKSWFMVCSSHNLPKGKVVHFITETKEMILFRDNDGKTVAMEGTCSHLGAKLKNAKWSRDGIICPLHSVCFCSDGNSVSSPIGNYRQEIFETREEYGSIFVSNGVSKKLRFPEFLGIPKDQHLYGIFPSKRVSTHWTAILVNAFDPLHLEFVHKRRLKEPPKISIDFETMVMELNYVSEVIGTNISDKIMKYLSNNTIRVRIRSFNGLVYTVEANLGRIKSNLLLSLNPFQGQTCISGVIIQKRNFPILDFLRISFATYLFRKFLFSDVQPLEGMQINHQNLRQNPVLRVVADYLQRCC